MTPEYFTECDRELGPGEAWYLESLEQHEANLEVLEGHQRCTYHEMKNGTRMYGGEGNKHRPTLPTPYGRRCAEHHPPAIKPNYSLIGNAV